MEFIVVCHYIIYSAALDKSIVCLLWVQQEQANYKLIKYWRLCESNDYPSAYYI